MIPVTKPFVPPRSDYEEYLEGVWNREYFTNNGPLVQELEGRLKAYLDIKNTLFVSNGTIALQLAIKALGLKGKIITTPFSYVATTSSIVWEGCEAQFVDIDPKTLNIDPNKIEEAITAETTAILATHVFGNPCDIDHIQSIADKHGLKVIYDAAHCFGTMYKERSVFKYGDISTTSFHATKLFHTVEGGAVFANDDSLHRRLMYMRNFGHDGPGNYNGVGINGKSSELHAAMGLCNLKFIEKILYNRRSQCIIYQNSFHDFQTTILQRAQEGATVNHAYFPIIFDSETTTLQILGKLEEFEIYPRRYFYPGLNTLEYVSNEGQTPISDSISKRIICLPLFYDLKEEDQHRIISIIKHELELAVSMNRSIDQ